MGYTMRCCLKSNLFFVTSDNPTHTPHSLTSHFLPFFLHPLADTRARARAKDSKLQKAHARKHGKNPPESDLPTLNFLFYSMLMTHREHEHTSAPSIGTIP